MSQQNIEVEDRFAKPAYRQVVEAAAGMAARLEATPADQLIEAAEGLTRPFIKAVDQMAEVVPVPPAAELAQYVEPQPTGGKARKVVKQLDHIAAKVRLYDRAVQEYNEMGARIKALQQEIAEEMEEANSAVVDGVEVFTYNKKNSYRTSDLRADYGDLCQHYMVPKTGLQLDMAKFAKDHPAIAERYQTREFRRTGGIQVLR